MLFLIFVMPIYALGNLEITVKADKISLDLVHDESTAITITIIHTDNFCNVLCTYDIIDDNTKQIVYPLNTKYVPKSGLSLSYTFNAPSKKDGGESGTRFYRFKAKCSEESSLICGAVAPPEEQLITLNYHLTSEEQSALQYLDSNLPSIKSNLEESEKKIYNIKSKFNELPKNILISDIKSDFGALETDFGNYKKFQQTIKDYYDNLDLLTAKNILSSSGLLSSSTLRDKANSLNINLQARIELHNKLVKDIKELSTSLNTFSKDITILNEVSSFNELKNKINSLSEKFNSGNFNSYDVINSEVLSIKEDINNLNKKIDSKRNELLDKIDNTISQEQSKLCNIKYSCNLNLKTSRTSDFVSNVDNVCKISISRLKGSFDEANKKDYEIYKGNLTDTQFKNDIITEKNKKINELNTIVKSLYDLLNKNDVEINIDECAKSFIDVKQIYYLDKSEKNYTDNSKNICEKLQKDASEKVKDKEKSFFYKFKRFFINIISSKKFTFEPISEIKTLNIPKEPILLEFAKEINDFTKAYCNIDLNLAPISKVELSFAEAKGKTLDKTSIQDTKKHESQCCVFGSCGKCCEGDECANDVKSYPVIFIHGHSFFAGDSPKYSLAAFNAIKDSLYDSGYLIGGAVLPNSKYEDVPKGEWGKSGVPVTIKVTYYYDVYDEQGNLLNKPSKSEHIDEYAKRLDDIIKLIKYRTGKNKVNMIAHSMGGLVARDYMKNYSSDSVNKLIMIGTPNQGITPKIYAGCLAASAGITECGEMKKGNNFLIQLNSVKISDDVKVYTIAGTGCQNGDGISESSSVEIGGATNFKIEGKCSGFAGYDFHTDLLNPQLYPKVLEYINEILKE